MIIQEEDRPRRMMHEIVVGLDFLIGVVIIHIKREVAIPGKRNIVSRDEFLDGGDVLEHLLEYQSIVDVGICKDSLRDVSE